MTKEINASIQSVLKEGRVFSPPKEFSKKAHLKTPAEWKKLKTIADRNPVRFWETQAKELFWNKKWKSVFSWKNHHAQWFAGGFTNASYNCLDRHLATIRKNKAALIWESEQGEVKTFTYQQLTREVCRFANGLKKLGLKKGDVAVIYMGMVPESIIAMLACSRIGVTHNVVFGGYSSDALKERMIDSKAKCLITQDVAYRRGSEVELKKTADSILSQVSTLQSVVVLQRSKSDSVIDSMKKGRDFFWHQLVEKEENDCSIEWVEAEHPLFILYTSGSTGKPKGILHTTAGYLTQAQYTSKMVFDLKEEDIYFCTADIGWITGHSYVTYGPLLNGATVFLYEGAPNYPDFSRFWKMIDRHQITIFYTAPTAIRAFMKAGEQFLESSSLKSLRLLGSVGEPINPEAWIWYYEKIGKKRCPIVDTWWQTETGSIMIAPLPGVTKLKPGTATIPLPGILADVVRKDGTPCKANEGGFLVIKHPWPGMLRTIFGNDERYQKGYWSEYPATKKRMAYYFTGDGARKDSQGNFWIMGRVDDVVNVSGHRLGTAEVESALVSHKAVAEAAVVARPDELKGNALVAFVTLKSSSKVDLKNTSQVESLKKELKEWVAKEIGALARPDEVRLADGLPKTRSGKIMRRLLREIAVGNHPTGDTSTLEDFSVLEKLRADEE